MDKQNSFIDTEYLSPNIARYFKVRQSISKRFDILELDMGLDIIFTYSDMKGDFKTVCQEFRELGYNPYLRSKNGIKTCVLTPARIKTPNEDRRELRKALILFFITIISTTIVGYVYSMNMVSMKLMANPWPGAFCFSGGLILILGSHEMAHKWAALKNGIEATPPYFIPLPIGLGTAGAVIRIKSPTPDVNASVALGASGPIVGFLVSLPILLTGLFLSPYVKESLFTGAANTDAFSLGEPLIMKLFLLIRGGEQAGYTPYLHPLAFAGWAGLLVTSLNLIPIAQLDGGHIFHAVFGHKIHRKFSLALVALLGLAGTAGILADLKFLGPLNILSSWLWSGWLVWAFFGSMLLKREYPLPMNEFEPLTLRSKLFAAAATAIFILCFMPVPITQI